MHDFYHLLVTRFNVRLYPDSDLTSLSNWTTERIALFEKYCLPSIQAQTNQNFNWLIQIDDSTSGENLAYFDRLTNENPNIYYAKFDDYDTTYLSIISFIQKKNIVAKNLITTRLDNDDLLHEDFISLIQNEYKKSSETRILNPLFGYTLDITKDPHLLFLTKQKENPFISLIEPMNNNLLTVRKFNHYEWSSTKKIENIISEEPLWIQLIHGKNLLNNIMGKAIATPVFLTKFQLENESAKHKNITSHIQLKINLLFLKIKKKIFNPLQTVLL